MEKEDMIHAYRTNTIHRLIGVMSGTSLDGVDAVLISVTTDDTGALVDVKREDQVSLTYSPEARERVSRLCIPGAATLEDLTYAHYGLAVWNAEAVNSLISQAGLERTDIDAVCMHGQTVWHSPVPKPFPGPRGSVDVTGTLQIGNAQVVASQTGLPVLSDFRSADMAEGGQGAPLAPYIDYLLFGEKGRGIAVQNIGGIGNVTVLPLGGTQDDVFAFDTGPGNMIMDALVSLHTSGALQFDEGGLLAASGTVSDTLLSYLMEDPYMSLKPPKSTGREVYGMDFSRSLQDRAVSMGLSFEDLLATATAFTALSIAQSYRDFVLPVTRIDKVVISGGGARNVTLLRMLEGYLGPEIEVTTSASYNIPDQAREAMAFALMGHESLMGRPANLPSVTGARKPVVLGTITMQHI